MPRSDSVVALSGRLSGHTGMRAREVAVWIDTSCQRARALVGASGRLYRQAVHQVSESSGTSPFASEAGTRHEFFVTRPFPDDPTEVAHLARSLYAESGLVIGKDEVLDLDANVPDEVEDRAAVEAAKVDETKRILLDPPAHALLVFQARIRFEMAGAEHTVKPDVLLWTGERWRVGEMKAYPDRGGYTDGAAVAKAVKQCAVGVVALMQHVDPDLVDQEVDLILRSSGRAIASLRTLPAEAEIESVRWAADHADEDAERFLEMTGGRAIDSDETLRLIPHEYGQECHGSCDLADDCKTEASSKQADRLGAGAFSHLGVSNQRAVELAGGARPENPSEDALAAVLRDGWNAATPT